MRICVQTQAPLCLGDNQTALGRRPDGSRRRQHNLLDSEQTCRNQSSAPAKGACSSQTPSKEKKRNALESESAGVRLEHHIMKFEIQTY